MGLAPGKGCAVQSRSQGGDTEQARNLSLTFYGPGQAPPGDKTQWGAWPAQGDNRQCPWAHGLSRAICGEEEACLLPPHLVIPLLSVGEDHVRNKMKVKVTLSCRTL